MRGRDRRGFGLMGLENERVDGWMENDGCELWKALLDG